MPEEFMLLFELIEGCLEAEGYNVILFKDTSTGISSGDGMFVEKNGIKFTVCVDHVRPGRVKI